MLLGVIVLSVLLNGIGVSLLGLKFGLPLQTEVGARGVGSRVAAEPCLGRSLQVPTANGVHLTPHNPEHSVGGEVGGPASNSLKEL